MFLVLCTNYTWKRFWVYRNYVMSKLAMWIIEKINKLKERLNKSDAPKYLSGKNRKS